MRIGAMAEAAGVQVNWRPFLLGPIFQAQGLQTSPFSQYPIKGRYMWRDMERICKARGLPLKRPQAFPQNSLAAARIALAGREGGWIESFSRACFDLSFGQGRAIQEEPVLVEALRAAGVEAQPALGRRQVRGGQGAAAGGDRTRQVARDLRRAQLRHARQGAVLGR